MKAFIIKKPQQERSRAKVSALITASARVLRTEGFKACTTAKIALESDVSIGTFYDYFSCKEAVLIAYLDERLNQALVHVKQQAENQQAESQKQGAGKLLRKFVRAGVDFAFDEGDIIKAVVSHSPANLQFINFELSKQQLQSIGQEFAQANQGKLVNKDPQLVLYSLTNLLLGFQMRIALMPDKNISREQITQEISEMIIAYLIVE